MAGAFAWGAVAAFSLVAGSLFAIYLPVGTATIGVVMAFGAGVLISAVSFDLVEEAARIASRQSTTIAGLFAGCAVFFGGDLLIDRAGGEKRKKAAGSGDDGTGLAIVLGTVLDGVPESVVIGLTLHADGSIGAAYLIAVFISNVPESLASTTGLRASGWSSQRIVSLWVGITLVSGLASLAGYALFSRASHNVVAFVLAFAAGAILTMLADTMMPEAYRYGGKLVGVVTTLGFATAFVIQALD